MRARTVAAGYWRQHEPAEKFTADMNGRAIQDARSPSINGNIGDAGRLPPGGGARWSSSTGAWTSW